MIIGITYGGNAPAAARYIELPAKDGRDVSPAEGRARLLGSHGFGFPVQSRDDVRLALDVMETDIELQASNTKPVQNTVIHASQSWHPDYRPTRQEMREAVEHLAKAWGMEEARRISWSHSDTKHQHLHTLFDPIHPDTGYVFRDPERNDRAQRAAIDWERTRNQIAPARQRDHDIAAAVEAGDYTRAMELYKHTDGSISRDRINRALSLGGKFGAEKSAAREEFIEQNRLTKFPRQQGQAHSTDELAREKRDYIDQNKEHSRGLQRAHNREKAVGIIRDIEDWPWKKIDQLKSKLQDKMQDALDRRRYKDTEVQRQNGTTVYPDWMNKRERTRFDNYERRMHERTREAWESQHGPVPQQASVERYGPREYAQDQEKKESKAAQTAEEIRLKNLEIQRARRDKEEGRRHQPHDPEPPWKKEERRSDAWRREQEMQQEEKDSRPLPETRLQKHWREMWGRPRPEGPQPLPRQESKREQPMSPIDQPQRWRDKVKDRILDGLEKVPLPGDRKFEEEMNKIVQEKFEKEEKERDAEAKREQRFQDGIDQAQGRARNSIERPIERPKEQPVPRFPSEQEFGRAARAYGGGFNEERDLPPNTDNRTPQQVKADEHSMGGRPGDTSYRHRQRAEDFYRYEQEPQDFEVTSDPNLQNGPPSGRGYDRNENKDGTAGHGRVDKTDAGRQGMLPGGPHRPEPAPQQSFRDQIDASQRNIQVPRREIERDQDRER